MKKELKGGIIALYAVIGALFAFFVKSEWDLFKYGNILWTQEYILKVLIFSLIGAVSFVGIYILIKLVLNQYIYCYRPKKGLNPLITFLGSFVITTLSYVPFLFAYYPGIQAYDVSIQLSQIVTNAYNDHHPIFHTLLMALSVKLFGNLCLATMVQLLLLSCSFAFVIFTLRKCEVGLLWQILAQAFFCLNPLNGFMAVSITKDTIFTAFFVFFVCSFFLLLKFENIWLDVLFTLSLIGSVLFRNNGRYAVLVMIIATLIALLCAKERRRFFLRLCLEMVGGFIVGIVLLKIAFFATHAVQGDKREMLSVPLQQIARVMNYEEEKITDEEKLLIDNLILYEAYKDYNPVISDPVKKYTNTYVVRYQTKDFLKVYLELFKKYPGDYINATLALIGGYVSPLDETYRIMKISGNTVTRNYIQHSFTSFGFEDIAYEASKLPKFKQFLDIFAESDGFNLPVLKIFFIPGIYLWIFIILFPVYLERRNFSSLIPLFFVLAFFGTLLLGPTMHLRYIYPCMAVLPAFLASQRSPSEMPDTDYFPFH